MLRVFFVCYSLTFFLLPTLLQAVEKISSLSNNEKNSLTLMNKAATAWLGILTSQEDVVDISIFSKNPKLNLLETEPDSNIVERIRQRKNEFRNGQYTINTISKITQKDKSITFKLVLDWEKYDEDGVTDSARIEEVMVIEYVNSKQDTFIIGSISEEYALPSDSLAVKLKC